MISSECQIDARRQLFRTDPSREESGESEEEAEEGAEEGVEEGEEESQEESEESEEEAPSFATSWPTGSLRRWSKPRLSGATTSNPFGPLTA